MPLRFLLVLSVLFFLWPDSAWSHNEDHGFVKEFEPGPAEYKRVSVIYKSTLDGDSFLSEDSEINIWGINAPEDKTYSYVARFFLESLLEKAEIFCKPVIIQEQLYHCMVGKSDVASLIVQMGMAKASDDYYAHEQEVAIKMKRGLWKDSGQQ